MVIFSLEHLGCDVKRGADAGLHRLSWVELAGQPEVDDFQRVPFERPLATQQEVFQLDVPVAHAPVVDVHDTGHDLLHEQTRVLLGEVLLGNEIIEKVAAGAQLHDQMKILRVLEVLVQPDDIRVVHQLHDLYLPMKLAHILDANPVHALDGPLRLGRQMRRHPDGARVPGPKCGAVRAPDVLHTTAVAEDGRPVARILPRRGGALPRRAGLGADLYQRGHGRHGHHRRRPHRKRPHRRPPAQRRRPTERPAHRGHGRQARRATRHAPPQRGARLAIADDVA
mmetsp:Transcript_34334/g.103646  ORF Transcript_34334/g.103646 Transcript_34334/m.103646 type:complete len:282 (+) Transcript_34334:1792-2637(+)